VRHLRGRVGLLAVVVLTAVPVACSAGGSGGATSRATTASSTGRVASRATTPRPTLAATVPLTATPAFSGTVAPVTATDLGASWREGCPVGPGDLRRLRLSYWGFDDQPHIGAVVVHADVTPTVLAVFRQLFDRRFPIRRMDPIDVFGGSDSASMDADNTSGFNCRLAVGTGPPQWSVHAYGRAIDVNPVENPYLEGGRILPSAGAAFQNRDDVRPGMAVPGGPLVDIFAAVGWQWGGRWTATPDYQHFSATGG
jgi:hypothetical protein